MIKTLGTARVGDRFLKPILNRADPRFGQQVVCTVTEIRQDAPGFISVIGYSTEVDHRGNRYGGGPGGRPDSPFETL